MEGQGVAASPASASGRQDEFAGAVVAAEFNDPGGSHVTDDILGDGEDRRHNGDDTIVMPAPDFSEPPAPGAAAFPTPPESAQSLREPQLPRAGFLPQSGPLPQPSRRPAAAPLPQEAEIPVRAPASQ